MGTKKKTEKTKSKSTKGSPTIGIITLTVKQTLCPKQGQDCQRSKIQLQEGYLRATDKNGLKVKGWEKIHHADSNHKRSRVAILNVRQKRG